VSIAVGDYLHNYALDSWYEVIQVHPIIGVGGRGRAVSVNISGPDGYKSYMADWEQYSDGYICLLGWSGHRISAKHATAFEYQLLKATEGLR
jgi:hypothetical protein